MRLKLGGGDEAIVQYSEDYVIDAVRYYGQGKKLRRRQWHEHVQKQLCNQLLANIEWKLSLYYAPRLAAYKDDTQTYPRVYHPYEFRLSGAEATMD